MNNHKHSSFLLFFQRFCLKPLVAAVVIFISVYLASVIADQKLQSWYLKIPQTFSLYSAIKPADNRKISMLDGCFHIFLDIGANWAITTRKLFEPHLYPGSPSLTYFDKYFGPDRLEKLSTDPKYICVVGFEANPRHTKKLKEVERVYQKCGWNVKMMTETAIYDQKGAVVTFSQGSWPDQNRTDVVGTIINPKHWRFSNKKGYTASVPTIRLSDFFHEHILNRLPNKRQSELKEDPKIVGKIDCESCEVELLFDLMNNGLLIKFNYMIVEYHHATVLEKGRKKRTETIKAMVEETARYCGEKTQNGTPHCKLEHTSSDDEEYRESQFPFPECGNKQSNHRNEFNELKKMNQTGGPHCDFEHTSADDEKVSQIGVSFPQMWDKLNNSPKN